MAFDGEIENYWIILSNGTSSNRNIDYSEITLQKNQPV